MRQRHLCSAARNGIPVHPVGAVLKHNRDSVSRRTFLGASLASLMVSRLANSGARAAAPADSVSFGLCSDPHYADRDSAGTRWYRDSEAKLTTFVRKMNHARPDFVIELGDFIDSGPTHQTEMDYLKRIEKVFSGFVGKRYHVIGNHDLARFSKEQFMEAVRMKASYDSFVAGPVRCLVLDANFNKDLTPYRAGKFDWTQTYIPPIQQAWLRDQLHTSDRKAVIFIHQRLDDENDPHGVKNSPDVRRILEDSAKVLAVFQGHDHRGGYKRINGIHYFTCRAMIEGPGPDNNAYALVTVSTNDCIDVKGFGKQPGSRLTPDR
jgi:predicted phosphodiesterase